MGAAQLALYRCGRQGEALQAYRTITRHLVEELGIDPARSCDASTTASSPPTRRSADRRVLLVLDDAVGAEQVEFTGRCGRCGRGRWSRVG